MFSKIGRFGVTPELRYTPNGASVTDFSLAWDVKRGENKRTEWANFTAWGKTAEAICEYFKKGNPIYIKNADYRTETWEDKESGEKRSRVVFDVRDFEFLPKNVQNGTEDSSEETKTKTKTKAKTKTKKAEVVEDDDDEDINF